VGIFCVRTDNRRRASRHFGAIRTHRAVTQVTIGLALERRVPACSRFSSLHSSIGGQAVSERRAAIMGPMSSGTPAAAVMSAIWINSILSFAVRSLGRRMGHGSPGQWPLRGRSGMAKCFNRRQTTVCRWIRFGLSSGLLRYLRSVPRPFDRSDSKKADHP